MVPLCRDELIVMSDGGQLDGRLELVTKVTKCVHIVDANPPRYSRMEQVTDDFDA